MVKELLGEGIALGVRQRFDEALELLSAQGAEVVEVNVPHCEYAVAAYYLILPAEASSNLAKFDSVRFGMRITPEGSPTVEEVMSATRDAGFGDEVKRRIILGTYALSAGYYDAYYGSAQKIRTLIQRDFAQSFEKVDVLLSPLHSYDRVSFGGKNGRSLGDVGGGCHHDSRESRGNSWNVSSHGAEP